MRSTLLARESVCSGLLCSFTVLWLDGAYASHVTDRSFMTQSNEVARSKPAASVMN